LFLHETNSQGEFTSHPIDEHGESTGIPEPVPETEIPILISGGRCRTIITRLEIACSRAGFYLTNYLPRQPRSAPGEHGDPLHGQLKNSSSCSWKRFPHRSFGP